MTDSGSDTEFEELLDFIKNSRGFDFTGYKRPSLMRRVTKRMQIVGVETYTHYLSYLECEPTEFIHLFNTLLINVTSFFRDRPAWDYVSTEVIPAILASKAPEEPIRIWSAACASGQEAYTAAIAIAEVLGMEGFRERVKIYATDVDDEALQQARQATYYDREMDGLLPHQITQFFEQNDNRFTFRKELRRSVIFGRHDLVQDAPISKIDLLICRNTLMYFNADLQSRILHHFHFALNESGFLFLGKAEMILAQTSTFTPVELKQRIFTKVARPGLNARLPFVSQRNREEAMNHLSSYAHLRECAFEHGPIARIVINVSGMVALINERARSLFNLTPRDLGRPLQDLEISYRPVELRSWIEQAYRERRMLYLREIEWHRSAETIYLDIQVCPLIGAKDTILGVSLNFIDITRYKCLQEELEHSNQELEMANEELQSTNEELETTNEELQSTNEELETTNEELQSTNEELETMNEELQSTNEELQTVNDELQRRSEELNQVNAFLQSILTSMKGAVVVVNRELLILIWNHKAENLWGLRTDEALMQHFLNLDIGLPLEQLRQPILNCLLGEVEDSLAVRVRAVNRRGKNIECQVICTPLVGIYGQIEGTILVMEEKEEG